MKTLFMKWVCSRVVLAGGGPFLSWKEGAKNFQIYLETATFHSTKETSSLASGEIRRVLQREGILGCVSVRLDCPGPRHNQLTSSSSFREQMKNRKASYPISVEDRNELVRELDEFGYRDPRRCARCSSSLAAAGSTVTAPVETAGVKSI